MSDAGWVRPDWAAPAHVHAAVSTRHGPGVSNGPWARFNLGTRSGDEAVAVAHNRAALQRVLALPSAPCWLHQVHGVQVARAPFDVVEPDADVAVTAKAGTVLAILTADCMPVLLCDARGGVVAAAHAGWRGLAAGVIEATVAAMGEARSDLVAWLGPCIGAPSYEVGDEVRSTFVDADAGAAAAFEASRPGHWRCHLEALARRRLAACGVRRVDGGGFDTFSDDRFYSYRRDGARSGRFASLIWFD